VQTRKWIDPHQPQTLYIAVFLLYANAFWAVVAMGTYNIFPLLSLGVVAGSIAGGWGIANELKWGYALGVVMAFVPFLLRLVYGGGESVASGSLVNLLFDIALVALLLHPESRNYQRIYFK